MTVEDPRPVAKAIEALENRYGWQITYEDIPYPYESDGRDGTPAAQRELKGYATAIPKEGTLSFTLPARPSAIGAVDSVVRV